MKKLLASIALCAVVLVTAIGIMVIQDRNRTANAGDPFTLLGPWPLEVLKPGADGILGYSMRFHSPATGSEPSMFDWSNGNTLRNSTEKVKTLEVLGFEGLNGEKAVVYLDNRDDTILGVTGCYFYEVSPDGKKVALVFPAAIAILEPGKDLIIVTPVEVGGKDVNEYRGQIPHTPYLFASVCWHNDNQTLAYRSRLDELGVSPGYNIWLFDEENQGCRVVRRGESGNINSIHGWMNGRILFMEPTLGVGLIDVKEGTSSLLTEAHINDLVISPAGDAAMGLDADEQAQGYVMLEPDGTIVQVKGLAEGERFSYGTRWSPNGMNVAFIASTSDHEDVFLAIAARTTDGVVVTSRFVPPDPDYGFTAGGPLDWLDDQALIVTAEAKTNRAQTKSWLLSVPEKGGNM